MTKKKCTLIKRLETLRGAPYKLRTPASEVPCIETSDKDKLCRNPLVSVHMLTYNHERFIRQAIEGVMMQKTDFEFELVIGEDASQDKTREMCFEYQKKYPDKIRVLWSENNVYAIGGNGTRVSAACRGQYIAYCEGDDFWVNPNKLQVQIDAFRKNPDLGICLMGTDYLIDETGERHNFDKRNNVEGIIAAGKRASDFILFHTKINGCKMNRKHYQTSGWMVKGELYKTFFNRISDISSLRMSFGDTILLAVMAEWSDLLFIGETASVYRVNKGSVSFTKKSAITLDATIFKLYWLVKVRHWPFWLAKLRYLFRLRKARKRYLHEAL